MVCGFKKGGVKSGAAPPEVNIVETDQQLKEATPLSSRTALLMCKFSTFTRAYLCRLFDDDRYILNVCALLFCLDTSYNDMKLAHLCVYICA
jgi:hypothetical protein